MSAFALIHFPGASDYTLFEQTAGEPLELKSCEELSGRQGFVVAPFAPSSEHPILLIHPDRVSLHKLPEYQQSTGHELPAVTSSPYLREAYHDIYTCFIKMLRGGRFDKLVLSRSIDIERTGEPEPVELFQKACVVYPSMTVMMVSTKRSGLWLTVTPECLLTGDGTHWETVALAGTKVASEKRGWSDKEIQEQRYVASYIIDSLSVWADEYAERGPKTVYAGHLAHLRSVFPFTMSETGNVGKLLESLHPTPAVCGVPKDEAFHFILGNEGHDRSYYSGFMGPFNLKSQTNLYVTLRCMQILGDRYRLYAGGGLLTDSDEEQEWLETEAKLDTMRALLINRKS